MGVGWSGDDGGQCRQAEGLADFLCGDEEAARESSFACTDARGYRDRSGGEGQSHPESGQHDPAEDIDLIPAGGAPYRAARVSRVAPLPADPVRWIALALEGVGEAFQIPDAGRVGLGEGAGEDQVAARGRCR